MTTTMPSSADEVKLSSLIRNASARGRVRHSNRSGITRPGGRQHHDDLHACLQSRCSGCQESRGSSNVSRRLPEPTGERPRHHERAAKHPDGTDRHWFGDTALARFCASRPGAAVIDPFRLETLGRLSEIVGAAQRPNGADAPLRSNGARLIRNVRWRMRSVPRLRSLAASRPMGYPTTLRLQQDQRGRAPHTP